MLQLLITVLIVAAALLYCLWPLLPAALRARFVGQRAYAKQGGCSSCNDCGACTPKPAAAGPQTLVFHPPTDRTR